MHLILNIASAAAAFGAAAFWLWSTTPKLPDKFTSPYSAPSPELVTMVAALKKQSWRNAMGAAFAAAAAVLQAVAIIT